MPELIQSTAQGPGKLSHLSQPWGYSILTALIRTRLFLLLSPLPTPPTLSLQTRHLSSQMFHLPHLAQSFQLSPFLLPHASPAWSCQPLLPFYCSGCLRECLHAAKPNSGHVNACLYPKLLHNIIILDFLPYIINVSKLLLDFRASLTILYFSITSFLGEGFFVLFCFLFFCFNFFFEEELLQCFLRMIRLYIEQLISANYFIDLW